MRILSNIRFLNNTAIKDRVDNSKYPNMNPGRDIFVKSANVSFTSAISWNATKALKYAKNFGITTARSWNNFLEKVPAEKRNDLFILPLLKHAQKLNIKKPDDAAHLLHIMTPEKAKYVKNIAIFHQRAKIDTYHPGMMYNFLNHINEKNLKYLDFIADNAKNLNKSKGFENSKNYKWSSIFNALCPENEECLPVIAKNPNAFNIIRIHWHMGDILEHAAWDDIHYTYQHKAHPEDIKARIQLIKDVADNKIGFTDLGVEYGNQFAGYVVGSTTKDNCHLLNKENIGKIWKFMDHFNISYDARVYSIFKDITPKNEYCLDLLTSTRFETPREDEYKRFLFIKNLVKNANQANKQQITNMVKQNMSVEEIVNRLKIKLEE